MGTFCTFLILSIHKGQYQAIDLDQTRMDKRDDLYRAKGIVLPAEQGGKCRSVDFAISLICGISNIRLTLTRHIFIDLEKINFDENTSSSICSFAAARIKVFIEKLLRGFKHCILEVYCIILVQTAICSLGIRGTHRKNIENLNSCFAHGPGGVRVVKLYALNKQEK